MHEKSPYMMIVLLGSLVMMMTASLVFHVPQNGEQLGLMSSIFDMKVQRINEGNTLHAPFLKMNQNFNTPLSQ